MQSASWREKHHRKRFEPGALTTAKKLAARHSWEVPTANGPLRSKATSSLWRRVLVFAKTRFRCVRAVSIEMQRSSAISFNDFPPHNAAATSASVVVSPQYPSRQRA